MIEKSLGSVARVVLPPAKSLDYQHMTPTLTRLVSDEKGHLKLDELENVPQLPNTVRLQTGDVIVRYIEGRMRVYRVGDIGDRVIGFGSANAALVRSTDPEVSNDYLAVVIGSRGFARAFDKLGGVVMRGPLTEMKKINFLVLPAEKQATVVQLAANVAKLQQHQRKSNELLDQMVDAVLQEMRKKREIELGLREPTAEEKAKEEKKHLAAAAARLPEAEEKQLPVIQLHDDRETLRLLDGKYELVVKKNGGMEALRNGEPWRDLAGDNLVYGLFAHIQELEQALKVARAAAAQVQRKKHDNEELSP